MSVTYLSLNPFQSDARFWERGTGLSMFSCLLDRFHFFMGKLLSNYLPLLIEKTTVEIEPSDEDEKLSTNSAGIVIKNASCVSTERAGLLLFLSGFCIQDYLRMLWFYKLHQLVLDSV